MKPSTWTISLSSSIIMKVKTSIIPCITGGTIMVEMTLKWRWRWSWTKLIISNLLIVSNIQAFLALIISNLQAFVALTTSVQSEVSRKELITIFANWTKLRFFCNIVFWNILLDSRKWKFWLTDFVACLILHNWQRFPRIQWFDT